MQFRQIKQTSEASPLFGASEVYSTSHVLSNISRYMNS